MSKRSDRLARSIIELCCLAVLSLLALLNSAHRVAGADSALTEIKETFTGGDFDRTRWALLNTTVAVTKADFSRGAMRLIVPPGPDVRPLVGLNSRFGLEGDFDVSVDYSLRLLPRPEKEWVNVSIFIGGPDGMAAMTRTNNANSGHGYSTWFQPPAGSKTRMQAGGAPTEDKAGTLRLARVGRELHYYASSRGQPLKQIGTVEFGDHPIETLGFQVLPPGLKAPVDVEFDNILVKADRITGLVFVPQSDYGYLPWILSGLMVLIVLILLGWWSTRRAR